jgi:hypothetical protein
MAVISFGPVASASFEGGRIEASSRAGISNFGAQVTVTDATLECNPIHFAAQNVDTIAFGFADGGGNHCGCSDTKEECSLQLTELQAPEPP